MAALDQVHSRISNRLSEGHAVIYAVESNPTDTIRQLVKAGIEAEDHIRNDSLIVLDKQSAYLLKTKLDGSNEIDPWHSLISKKQKEKRFKGVFAVIMNEKSLQSYQTFDYKRHLAFEQMIGNERESDRTSTELVCCYTEESLSGMALKDLITILASHGCTIHDGWKYREWLPINVLQIIGKGIDNSLGVEAAKLIFQTLRLVYKMQEGMIVARSELFEETLRMILGESGADSVLGTVSKEIEKIMLFSKVE